MSQKSHALPLTPIVLLDKKFYNKSVYREICEYLKGGVE